MTALSSALGNSEVTVAELQVLRSDCLRAVRNPVLVGFDADPDQAALADRITDEIDRRQASTVERPTAPDSVLPLTSPNQTVKEVA